MVEKIQSKERTKSSGSSLNSLDLVSEITHCHGMEPTEQLQSRQDVDDAAWILFNMSLQREDDSVEKKINDPFIGFPKKKRSIPQNPKWVSSMDQLQCAQDMDDASRVLCNMQSKPLIGLKRCLQIQEKCGDALICKKQKTTSEKPEMPQKVKDEIFKMGGSEVRFVIQKPLQCSDTNHQQARLQIPVKQVENDFLSKEEEAVLEQTNQGIAVLLIQPSNNISTHCLKKRRIGKAGVYHITNKWNAILDDQANGLTTGATIQIWSFRAQSSLCFAMVTLQA